MKNTIFYKLWQIYKYTTPHFIYVKSELYLKYRFLFTLVMYLNKNYVPCEIFKKRHNHLKDIVIIGLKWNGKNVRRRTNGYAKNFIKKHKNIKCLYCNTPLNYENSTTDHIVPISKGGSNAKVNFVVCCKDCNSERGEQEFLEYLKIKNDKYKDVKYPYI